MLAAMSSRYPLYHNDGLMTFVFSIQYIGMMANNSKPLPKNNHKPSGFAKKPH
jgi:hypothetical protein